MWSAVARREAHTEWFKNVIVNNGGIYYLPKGFMDEMYLTPQHRAIRALVKTGKYRIETRDKNYDAIVGVDQR